MALRLNIVTLAWEPVSGSSSYDILLDNVKVAQAGPRAKTTKIYIPEGAEHKVTIKAQPSGKTQEAKFNWAEVVAQPPQTFQRFASRTGSDSNPGTEAAPYKTANKLFNSLLPGEHGAMRAGVYDEHISGDRWAIYMASAGSTAQADGITVSAYPGESVLIKGPAHIYRHWLRMENISVNAYPYNDTRDDAWWVEGNDHYYYNCTFANNWGDGNPWYYASKGSAMFVSGTRTTVDHCTFHDVLWDGTGNQPHGVYCGYGSQVITVKNSKFWNIGSGPVSGQYGVQLYGSPAPRDSLIQNCIFDNVNSGISLGDVQNVTIENNIFSNTGYYQGAIWDGGGTGTIIRNNHTWNLGSVFVQADYGGTRTISGTTSGDPLYTDAAGHVYYPFTGVGTSGKGTNW